MRGTGFRHTLPSVFPFTALWVLLVVLTAPIVTVSMMFGGLVRPSDHGDIWFFLLTRMPVLALAAVALAIFTTQRAAGPLVALRVALDDVARGDMGRRLRFRRSDKHLREVEIAFNAMMEALSERAESARDVEAVE
jgi:methyl-accepting chemotaxis protein